MSHYLVNELPGIEQLRYLELGIYDGENFKLVRAQFKTSCDVEPKWRATFVGTTDAFFAQLTPNAQFDAIYIDACHSFSFVLRDFNNSVAHLAPRGVILCHDLVPPTEASSDGAQCGDAYKLLVGFIANVSHYSDFFVQDEDHGLTLFRAPPLPPASWLSEYGTVPYASFRSVLTAIPLYGVGEMQRIARETRIVP